MRRRGTITEPSEPTWPPARTSASPRRRRDRRPLLHDDVGLDVEEQVVVAPADLKQEGRLLEQRPLQVGRGQQRSAVQFHDDVAVPDTAPERWGEERGREREREREDWFGVDLITLGTMRYGVSLVLLSIQVM